jgi:uncharacterized protein
VLLALIRLTTSSRVFQSPLTTSEALDLVDGWLAQPRATRFTGLRWANPLEA